MSAPSAGGSAHLQLGPLDELVSGGNPYVCAACVAVGEVCAFHAGWAAGWDACAAFVAHAVDDERASELTGELRDVEGVA